MNETFVEQMDIIDKALIELQNQPASYPMKQRKQYRFKNTHPMNNNGNIMNGSNIAMNGGVPNYNPVVSGDVMHNSSSIGQNTSLGSTFPMDYSPYLSGSFNAIQHQPQQQQQQQQNQPYHAISSSTANNINPVFDPFNSNFGSGVLNLKSSGLSSNIWGNGNSSSISTDATVWG